MYFWGAVIQNVAQNSEMQLQQAYHGEKFSLSEITAHTAEVLQLVEKAWLPKGGWVRGDSWFQSISTAVEAMARFPI